MIGGVPATGKSTIALKLANLLSIKVCVGLDEVKEVIKIYETDPFIHKSSHDAWELIGPHNKTNIIKGFVRYCQVFQKSVQAIIKRSEKNGENVILEGVQLLPKFYYKNNNFHCLHFLITSKLSQCHKKKINSKISERHTRQIDVWSCRATEIRLIQAEMLKQSEKYHSIIIKEDTLNRQLEIIINCIKESYGLL